jgi:anti-anti-sigma regulatory factor
VLHIVRGDSDASTATLLLQGRVVAEWADLLERECLGLIQAGRAVVLDLSDVVFIGRSGIAALGRLDKAGVRITGCTPLIAAMLEQEGIAARRTTWDAEYR